MDIKVIEAFKNAKLSLNALDDALDQLAEAGSFADILDQCDADISVRNTARLDIVERDRKDVGH